MAIQQERFSFDEIRAAQTLTGTRWLSGLRRWYSEHSLMRDLGGESTIRRDAAIEALIARGAAAIPMLHRALTRSPLAACAAADALAELGVENGVQTVLVRCYDEEWLSDQPARTPVLAALRQLRHASIGLALEAGLASAPGERHLQPCFDRLTLSLSAFRLLLVYGVTSPAEWWERGLFFGRASLPKLRDNPFAGLAHGLTDHIRAAALRGMLSQHADGCLVTFARALKSDDVSIMRTAVAGMYKTRDVRALPLLQQIAFSAHHPLALEARKAIETIVGAGADPLVLLRGSYADANVARHDDLVRPATVGQPQELCALLRSVDRL